MADIENVCNKHAQEAAEELMIQFRSQLTAALLHWLKCHNIEATPDDIYRDEDSYRVAVDAPADGTFQVRIIPRLTSCSIPDCDCRVVVAARALFAADATALYATIRAQAVAAPRDLSSFEAQCTLRFVKRELDTAITRALRAIHDTRQDAAQHLPARLHNFLKAERAKRDKFTLTVSAVRSFEERDASESEARPGGVVPRAVPAAKIVRIPPPGHPDRDRLMAEAMAAREAAEAELNKPLPEPEPEPDLPAEYLLPELVPSARVAGTSAARWAETETTE